MTQIPRKLKAYFLKRKPIPPKSKCRTARRSPVLSHWAICFILLFLYSPILPPSSLAASKPKTTEHIKTPNKHSMRLQFFLGYQGLRSHEYVLSTDDRSDSRNNISELIWNSFNNLLLGLAFNHNMPNLQYSLQTNTSINLDDNLIYDYDWLYTDKITQDAPSNYSRHDTVQNFLLEASMRIGLPIFDNSQNRIDIGIGLFFSYVDWDAFDGALRYSDPAKTSAGKITGRVFSYEIWHLAPQIYIKFNQKFPPTLEMQLLFAYSPMTIWQDKDNHYFRNLLFYDSGIAGQQIFAELQVSFWNLLKPLPSLGFVLGLSGRYLFKSPGNVEIHNADETGNPVKLLSQISNGSAAEQGSFQIYAGIALSIPPIFTRNKTPSP